VSASLANYFQVLGHLDRAVESGQRALAIAVEQRDRATQVAATAYLSLTYQTLGEYSQGIALARQTLGLLAGDASRQMLGMPLLPAVYVRTSLSRGLAETGDFVEARALARECVEIAGTASHSYSLAFALLGLGVVQLRQGEHEPAVETLEASFGLSAEGDSPTMAALIAGFLGAAYASAGRPDEVVRTIMNQAGTRWFYPPSRDCRLLETALAATRWPVRGSVDLAGGPVVARPPPWCSSGRRAPNVCSPGTRRRASLGLIDDPQPSPTWSDRCTTRASRSIGRVERSATMRPPDLPRVLVIEDRASIRALLCGRFTMLGYDAQPACDRVEALGWLRQAPYDLVVTDLTMPGASGWDVIDAVRRHAQGTPVIIVTGTATEADRQRAREQAVMLLDKPFRIEAFRAAVDRALFCSPA